MTPTTCDQASVRSVWTATPWCCQSTLTVSPVWRYCLLDGTAEETEFTVAPVLLIEQFSQNRVLGVIIWRSGSWGASPMVGGKVFLCFYFSKPTACDIVRLKWNNGLFPFYWLEASTRHLTCHSNSYSHTNWSKANLEGLKMAQNSLNQLVCLWGEEVKKC